jgi:hypothetical protein
LVFGGFFQEVDFGCSFGEKGGDSGDFLLCVGKFGEAESEEGGWQIAPVKTGRMQEVKVLYNERSSDPG